MLPVLLPSVTVASHVFQMTSQNSTEPINGSWLVADGLGRVGSFSM